MDKPKPICAVSDCVELAIKRGWCSKHYQRWWAHGDPLVYQPKRPSSTRFWEKVAKAGPDDCWPWTGAHMPAGYGNFWDGSGGYTSTHRFAWEDTHGPIPDGLWVLHRCDNPLCCNPLHLWLGTCADNNADRDAKGRSVEPPTQYGEAHPHSKLTEADVTEIRRLAEAGQAQVVLAEMFGITQANVSSIVKRRTWGHIS